MLRSVAIKPHLKEESLRSLLIKIFLILFLIIAIFKHIFELLRGLPNSTHILVCHSVISWWNPDFHTPIKRGYPELSFDPISLNISGVITKKKSNGPFKFRVPRRSRIERVLNATVTVCVSFPSHPTTVMRRETRAI